MLWHHGAAVHRKRVNVRKRSKMLALANGSLIEMHTPRHWALTILDFYIISVHTYPLIQTMGLREK